MPMYRKASAEVLRAAPPSITPHDQNSDLRSSEKVQILYQWIEFQLQCCKRSLFQFHMSTHILFAFSADNEYEKLYAANFAMVEIPFVSGFLEQRHISMFLV
jgi:hypothetical protein